MRSDGAVSDGRLIDYQIAFDSCNSVMHCLHTINKEDI